MISKDDLSYRWVILAMFVCFQLVLSIVAFGWGALAPFLKELMSLNSTELGLISSTFFIAAGLSSFPGGIIVDHFGERKGILISLGMSGFSLICLGFVYSIHILFLAMVAIAGLGYGMNNPAAAKGLLAWFDQKTRGTVFGIRQSSVTLGGAVAAVFLVYTCQKIGPINAILMVGFMIMIMLIVAFFFYQTPEMGKNSPINTNTESENKQSLKPGLRGHFTNKALVAVFVVVGLMGLAQGIIITFFLIYIKEGLGYSVSAAGFLLSVLMIGGTVGRVFWGLLSDRLFSGRRKPILIIISALIAISVTVLAFWSCAWPKSLFFLVVIGLGISSLGWSGIATVLLAEVSVRSRAASSVGLASAIGWIGMFIGPLGFGVLTDTSGYFHAWMALAVFSFFSLILCSLLPISKQDPNIC